jgi:hypothetical protein
MSGGDGRWAISTEPGAGSHLAVGPSYQRHGVLCVWAMGETAPLRCVAVVETMSP